MVIFNELYIDTDGLHVNVSLDGESYFKDMYIKGIIIDSESSFVAGGPSYKPVYKEEFSSIQELLSGEDLSNVDKEVLNSYNKRYYNKVIKDSTLRLFEPHMYFVYVILGGIPAQDIPCTYDRHTHVGVVYDTYPIHKNILAGIKDIEDVESIPTKTVNDILRYKVFELAVKTGDYTKAIHYWNKFYKQHINPNTCECSNKLSSLSGSGQVLPIPI